MYGVPHSKRIPDRAFFAMMGWFAFILPILLAASPLRAAGAPDIRELLPGEGEPASPELAKAIADLRAGGTNWESCCLIAREETQATWVSSFVSGLCAWRDNDATRAVQDLLAAWRASPSNAAPAVALAAFYAADGSSPEAVGWLRRAHATGDTGNFRETMLSRWFERVRYTSLFREMVRDLRDISPKPDTIPGDESDVGGTGVPFLSVRERAAAPLPEVRTAPRDPGMDSFQVPSLIRSDDQ